MTLKEIKEDLKEIRYYYARKDFFDSAVENTGLILVLKKVDRYNKAARFAPIRLFDIYVGLYLKNQTQEEFADGVGYTPQYIQILHKKLLIFFQSYFKNGAKGEKT